MAPLSIDKSGAACGNGILFSIPEDYPDWSNATKFVWTLTSVFPAGYTPATITSGSKDSHFFVPYDATERTYEVSVYAESSTKVRSLGSIELQTGQITATPKFSINGYNCYDIKKTPYDKDEYSTPTKIYGRWESRTALNSPAPDPQFSYSVLGSGTLTYAWTIFDPDTILTDDLPASLTTASIDIQFKPWILEDDWLINQPTHERIVILTCVVTDGGSCKYVVSKEIKIGDRDCCARLTDTENNIYSAVRFGTAGCWMSENLAVTKNQKRNNLALTAKNSNSDPDYYNPYYTFPSTKTGTHTDPTLLTPDQARNSNFYGNNEGKPGLLYTWAAAVGAKDETSTANGGGARDQTTYPDQGGTSTLGQASNADSKEEDICPVGWYLPSDAEWTTLEREIAAHPGKYTPSMVSTGTSTWPETTAYRNNISPGHGEAMRNPKNTSGSYPQFPAGQSNPKESGFSGLLVGYALSGSWRYYNALMYYWSSSSSSGTNAWRRELSYNSAGVYRFSNVKYYLYSVRCKKLD
jgi:uncharacterized protein (TIGR02145 family)